MCLIHSKHARLRILPKKNLFNVLSNYLDFEEGVRALDLFCRYRQYQHRACVQRLRPGYQYRKRP